MTHKWELVIGEWLLHHEGKDEYMELDEILRRVNEYDKLKAATDELSAEDVRTFHPTKLRKELQAYAERMEDAREV